MKNILTLGCLSFVMIGCTQTNPAKIHDISDSSSDSASAYEYNSPSYTAPPANISTDYQSNSVNDIYSTKQNQNYSDNSTSYIKTEPQSQQKKIGNASLTEERMVYNRNYDEIPKGGYVGDTYTVNRGDTLFYIAWVTGNDYRSLAAKNNIKEPYGVQVGQVLDVSGGTTVVVTQKTTANLVTNKPQTKNSKTSLSVPVVKPAVTALTTTAVTTTSNIQPDRTVKTITNAPIMSTTQKANIAWRWPVKGKIIEKFSNTTKGIDISGSLGNKIVAAADGRVVYSGNALPGYGNLIIIKHSDDYLTAYAHNQNILVKEQQMVKGGEQIATMGATGTSSVRLHFEIRYKSKSVDPLKYLPN